MGRPRKFSLDETYFEKIDNPNKSYIVGFIYADGNVYKNNLTICIKKDDIEILNFIKNELNYGGIIKINDKYIKLTITSSKITNDLRNLGVIQNKTYLSKSLPKIDNLYFPDFLRGLFDGDGSIYSNKKENRQREYTVNFSSNIYILECLKEKLKSLNITTCNIRYRRKNSLFSCMLDIRGTINILKFHKLIYYNNDLFCLKRKHQRFLDLLLQYENQIIKRKSNSEINMIKELYNKNISQSNISKILSIKYSTVRGIIQKLRRLKQLI